MNRSNKSRRTSEKLDFLFGGSCRRLFFFPDYSLGGGASDHLFLFFLRPLGVIAVEFMKLAIIVAIIIVVVVVIVFLVALRWGRDVLSLTYERKNPRGEALGAGGGGGPLLEV